MTPSAELRLERFRQCSTAEEYFEVLEVPFDPKVVNVNRLHILRHLAGQLADLHQRQPAPENAEDELAAYRAALIASYQTFTTSTSLDHRLFKVLVDHAPQAFVPLAEVGLPVPGGAG